ncbi:MAG: tetratricopeptide repeat protein [Gemmatimonadetes bacterium]|nr:tetratricopeptide repeat protein [Gemmatimonadota bacterium]
MGDTDPARLVHLERRNSPATGGNIIRHVALAVLFLAAWTQTAQADFTQEIQRCDFSGNHPDIRIVACTRNIQSGRFTGQNLAVAFTNRGLAYKSKGQWDRAIADFSEAIRLNPDFAEAFTNRGNIYHQYTGYRPTYSEDVHGGGQQSPFFWFLSEVLRSFADDEPFATWATQGGALQIAIKRISKYERGIYVV